MLAAAWRCLRALRGARQWVLVAVCCCLHLRYAAPEVCCAAERWLAAACTSTPSLACLPACLRACLQRLRILEFTLDHEAPYFTNMRRRTSRKVGGWVGGLFAYRRC